MSRTEGSFKISGALEPRIASALDARTIVQTKSELTASGNFPYPFVGLEVYVVSENKKYRFIGSDTTDINDWEEVGSGGGESIQVDTLPTASIDELGNIYQYVGVSDANYTNGCFYACVSDGEATPTYSWEMKPVMPSLSSGGIDEIVNPLPTGGRVTGFTPIGTIIPMIAETAPLYYLKCDGATYNKADYPELAAHLLSMTNHSMYEVSGDDTKFKVPDLSGEFLRGTGTNSHTNQGNGSAVGVHQDATTTSKYSTATAGTQHAIIYNSGNRLYPTNFDSEFLSANGTLGLVTLTGTSSSTGNTKDLITSRPTNTSVLYCIATKDIYIDARNIYSTTEKVVGEWIDGKPLYQRTFELNLPSDITDYTYKNVSEDLSACNVEKLISCNSIMGDTNDSIQIPIPFANYNDSNGKTKDVFVFYENSTTRLKIYCNASDYSGKSVCVTIQYTKATT